MLFYSSCGFLNFFSTLWSQGLLHARQVSYLVIAPVLFVFFFPLGQGLTKLCSSPPSGSEVAGIKGLGHCSSVCILSLRSQHQHTFIVSFFFLCFCYHTRLYFYIGTIYKVRCSREGRKYLTFVCHILLSASCRLNHEERNRDTDVQLLL